MLINSSIQSRHSFVSGTKGVFDVFHAAAAPPPLFFASSSAFALSKFALHFSQQKNSSAQKHPRYRPMSNVGFAVNVNNAVAQQMSEYHGRNFERNEVLVSVGAKHSLANFFMVTLEEGDEVIYPAPYWVSYPEMVRLAGGRLFCTLVSVG